MTLKLLIVKKNGTSIGHCNQQDKPHKVRRQRGIRVYSQEAVGPVLEIPPPRFPRPNRGCLGGPPPKLERKPNPGNGKHKDYLSNTLKKVKVLLYRQVYQEM